MKKFTLSLIMFISVFYSYSQSGTYLVALKYKVCGSPLTNTFSAIITDPAGNTTLQVLPDAINDDLNYGTQLNQIFSNITIQGFLVKTEVIHPSIITDLNGCVSDYRQYLFAPCCAPWTSSGIEPEGVNNSQFKLLNAFPNPTQEKITVEFDYTNESVPDKILLFDLLGNELCQHEITDLISKTITLDVSKFEGGLYLLVLKSKNQYSIPFDIIIQ